VADLFRPAQRRVRGPRAGRGRRDAAAGGAPLRTVLCAAGAPGVAAVGLAEGASVIKRPSPLNVLKSTYDRSCY
jgi:hypothetical protein